MKGIYVDERIKRILCIKLKFVTMFFRFLHFSIEVFLKYFRSSFCPLSPNGARAIDILSCCNATMLNVVNICSLSVKLY